MLDYIKEMPEDFKKELSTNFCAMKYIHGLPDKKRKKVFKKAAKMNDSELKDYVARLGTFI